MNEDMRFIPRLSPCRSYNFSCEQRVTAVAGGWWSIKKSRKGPTRVGPVIRSVGRSARFVTRRRPS